MLRAPAFTRRQFSLAVAGALCSFHSSRLVLAEDSSAPASVPLLRDENAPEMQIHAVLEGAGELIGRSLGATQKPTTYPMKVQGDLVYAEKSLPKGQAGALRWYQQAAADTLVGSKPRKVELREDRRHFLIQLKDNQSIYRCLEGPLSREERDLLELPAASHHLSLLLPNRSVAIGEAWTLEDAALAQLFHLDAVTTQDLKCQLDSCEGETAQLSFQGKVLGSARGVITELNLQGKYQYSVARKQITWLAMGLEENREPGLAEPGVRVKARLRMGLEPSVSPHLNEELSATIMAQADQSAVLEYRPASGRFMLAHQPQWFLFEERFDLTVLRLIDQDRLIAQCNLRPMDAIPRGNGLTLQQFQQEIRAALGKNVQQIIDSQETMLPNETRQLRIALSGQVADAAIHWIYYHLTDAEGHRMTCVFTLSGDQMERFGGEDTALMSGLSLAPIAKSEATEVKPVAQQPPLPETTTR